MMNNFLLGYLLILTTLCTGTATAGFNESCSVDFNCTESVPNTKCSDDSLCVCNDNYVYSTNKCITVPIVNITDDQYSEVIGSSVVIPCTVSGDDATSAYWTFTGSNGEQNLTSAGRYTVAALPNPDLNISTVNTTDTGTYKCKASNAAGESSDMAALTVTGGLPTVIIQSQYSKLIGENITISCTVSGTPTVTSVEWTFTPTGGSEQILSAGGRYTITNVSGNTELTVSSLVKSDSGRYTCKATSAAGQSSNSTMLNVGGGVLNVTVTPPPIIKIGEDVTISCVLIGQPTATDVQWKRNDSLLDISNTARYTGGSVSFPSLTIKNVTRSDAGSYQCLAINDAGTGESIKVTLTTMDRQFGDSCGDDLPCDDSKNLQCVNNKCGCKNTHYPDNNVCYDRKQLNESCANVMQCVDEPQVTCNAGFCSCNAGYYDDNGLASGGSCKARKALGDSCNTTVLCLENIRCATDNKCRCPDNLYDDNSGTCKDINELKVTAFTLTASTTAIVVTWTLPTAHTYVSRYDVRWRINGTGSAYSTTSAGTASTLTINQGLMAGQAYDVFIESVDNYTQVGEQKIASDTKVVRLKPNPPGSITNPSALDAPKINLMWTASPNSVVTQYMVMVVEKNSVENTTTNTPSLTLNTELVPGVNYTIKITAVSGTPSGAGGETLSVTHEERIRTIVEKPSPPVNVKCPVNPKDRSLEITWSAPDHPNGIIQYYEVYVYYGNGSVKEEINTTGAVTTFNVQNLTPESTFGFAVSAVNDGDESIRTSNMTTRINCTTKAALSTMPQNLAVSNIESRNFTVTFNKPATTNGRLTGYVVFVYQEEKTPQKCVQKILFRCSDCGNNYIFIQPNQTCLGKVIYQDVSNLPDTPSISYLVMDLLPYMDYTVETAGINAAGEGNLAPLQNFIKTGQEEPNKPTITAVTDIGQTQMKLQWNIAGPRPGPTNITVTVYEIIGNTRSVNKTVLFESAFDRTDFILIDLEEYWDYQFTVTAATVIGSVTSEMSDVIRTLPTAPGKVLDLTVVKASSDNYTAVQVSWKIPPLHQRNSYLDKYIIVQNFTTGSNNNVEIPVNLNLETNMQMFSVTPETYYSVEVYAKNNETTSNSTGEKSQMIYYAPPGPPKTTTVQSVVTTAPGGEQAQTKTFVVELNIDPFSDNTNGQVEYYGLVVCRRDKYIELTVQQGALSDEWINLPNYQTAKNQGYPPYRVTDGRFIQRVTQTMSQGRRKRSTTFQYPIGSETCANNTYYCNGPLPADTSFNVVVFICTAGGCSHSGPLGPYKTKAIPPEEDGPPIGIIVGVLAAVVVVTVVVIVFIVVRHRRRKPSTQKSYRDFNDVDNDSHDAEMDRIERNRPFLLSDINQVVATKHKDSNLLFAREYEELKNISPKHPTESSELDANKLKNRYVNILPFDHSRVKLLPTDDEPDSDFINANYLPGYKLQREYIGAQGPIPGTVDDFWRMIWEQNVGIVIMLTLCKEDGRVKCEPYWPMDLHEVKQYGEITVETVNVSTVNTYDFRIFKLKLGNENRSLKHFHFLQWKDFSANVQNDTMIEFIKNVRSHIQPPDKNGPIVVHCSAGVGRTGTFIALDHLLQFIDDHDFDSSVDIFDLVLKLRENRMFMVQTEQQYIFIHDVVRDYLERKRKAQQGEDLYQNVNLAFEPDENMYENVSSKKTEL